MTDENRTQPVIYTGVKVSDLANPVWRKALERTDRLSRVVSYAVSGEEKLVPLPRLRRQAHLDSTVQMSQRIPLDDLEARSLYIAGCTPAKELSVTAAVRRVTWKAERDWKRCRSRNVVNPHLEEEYFRVDDLGQIQEASAVVKEALESWTVDFSGVDVVSEQSQSHTAESYRVAERPMYQRWLSFNAQPAAIDLRFLNVWTDTRLNDAWVRLWDAFGAAFGEANRMTRVKISYRVPLKRYAQAIASMEPA